MKNSCVGVLKGKKNLKYPNIGNGAEADFDPIIEGVNRNVKLEN